ncbi:hypothetical protein DPMN_014665 [Dreissena polymorpha]|uniref:Uncharacterized protein n=1 Tax=Dreissena polymorpha TaxID=45954 RepID=A0A9D4S4T0_DREPO|nr:hypothetical protein DPMN_014665 [Dreissena polymorpha]
MGSTTSSIEEAVGCCHRGVDVFSRPHEELKLILRNGCLTFPGSSTDSCFLDSSLAKGLDCRNTYYDYFQVNCRVFFIELQLKFKNNMFFFCINLMAHIYLNGMLTHTGNVSEFPSQVLPYAEGFWFVQVLCCNLRPSAHVTEQLCHDPQLYQQPS